MSDALRALPGALVLSLDFELHWGVRDILPADGPYRQTLLAAREIVPELLRLFAEFEVACTWATVGFLFADSREELERSHPRLRPVYADPALDPYGEAVGEGESDDPVHYAPSLIEAIQATPGQEIATHTYSHYYCLEPGQTRDTFRADLEAARAIAARRGIELRSIVLPRNQYNPEYEAVMLDCGIRAYRGNQPGWMHREAAGDAAITRGRRAGRMLDSYLPLSGHGAVAWSRLRQPSGLANVPASAFLRRYRPALRRLEPLRLARLRAGMRHAARTRRIYHLWSHPHTFGVHVEEHLHFLRRVLEEFSRCRERYGMRSLSMAEVESTLGAAEDGAQGATSGRRASPSMPLA